MIGNDVIDIALSRVSSNWQRRGFLDKVFSESEQEIIHQSYDPFVSVWRLWSMKEAAYKSYLQQGGPAFNDPKRITIKLQGQLRGDAQIADFSAALKTVITAGYIYSYTLSTQQYSQINEVFELSQNKLPNQSAETHKKLKKRIAMDWQIEEASLSIIKDALGRPSIYFGEQNLEIPFSLSHHGKYGAFSFLKNDFGI